MNYIIDPKIFYIVSLLNSIKIFFMISGSICLGASCVVGVIFFATIIEEEDAKVIEKIKKICIKLLKYGLIIILISFLIPSEDTCLRMIVANYVTVDNASNGISTVKEIIDYIITSINNIKG